MISLQDTVKMLHARISKLEASRPDITHAAITSASLCVATGPPSLHTRSYQGITKAPTQHTHSCKKTAKAPSLHTHSSDGAAGQRVLSLGEVCMQMHGLGYKYAAFVPPDSLLDLARENPMHATKGGGKKPGNAAFFSLLVSHEDDEGTSIMIPEWYAYLQGLWISRLKQYTHSDLVFAEYDESKIIKQNNPTLMKTPYFLKTGKYNNPFDWRKISDDWAGIVIDEPQADDEPFGSWDVRTLAVWNYEALNNVRRFSFSGDKEFTYLP
jgi:hypothetical protein